MVYVYNLNFYFVTFLDFVRDAFDTSVANLRNMHETIGSWENFNKGAEIDNFFNLAKINFTNLYFLREIVDILDGFICSFLIG